MCHPSCMVRVNLLSSAMTQCLLSPGKFLVPIKNVLLHESGRSQAVESMAFDLVGVCGTVTDNIVTR